MKSKAVGIVGANGGFGLLLSRLLSRETTEIFGLDLHPEAAPGSVLSQYVQGDALSPSPEVGQRIAAADVVVLATPEAVTLAAIDGIARVMKSDALLLDVLSVKRPVCEKMAALENPAERLSLHPMFRPELGFDGRNVVAVEVALGPLGNGFLDLLRGWGAVVTTMDAATHDRTTAVMQVATHAALLAFGASLRELDYDAASAAAVYTPLHRSLLALLARVTTGDPAVYRDIQTSHPLGSDAREAVIHGLERLARLAGAGSPDEFAQMFEEIRSVLGPELPRLAEECQAIFEAQTEEARA